MHVVIVGNGVAGMEAALALRKRDPTLQITIISEESEHFFSRTALMWVLCGQMSHRDIEPYERDAYKRFDFQRVRDRVKSIDTQEQTVVLALGEPLRYDKLLIACGSKPRPAPWPGSDVRGVGHFVTLQDLEWLERELHGGPSRAGRPPNPDALEEVNRNGSPYRKRPSRRHEGPLRPAVIGGGLIGIEAVECFVAAGHEPDFFIREEWFWPMALEPREASWIKMRMEEHDVRVHLEHDVEMLESAEGELSAIVTDRGRHDANLCVTAIGVIPNTNWLADCGIDRDRQGGILVDSRQKTNVPNVFAAGDCASVRWASGRVAPEQLWYTSREQGRVAGRAILGDSTEYARGTWYNSAKLMDIEYTTVGEVHDSNDAETYFYEETGPVRSTTRIVTRKGHVSGFNLLGRRWDHTLLMRWIEEGRTLEWVHAQLTQASFDTEFVPTLQLGPLS